MRNALTGLLILVAAVGLCWGVVVLGQAHATAWITRAVGPVRASNPATFEALAYLIIFAPLIVIALLGGVIERRNALAPGARPVAGFGVGLLIGLAGVSVAVLYAWLSGGLADNGAPNAGAALLLWGLGVVALQVTAEELYFRGWLQPALTARWGQPLGIVAAALAFGALHVAGGARAPVSLLNLFLGGLMFGLFAARNGGLAAAMGVHFAWNAAEQLGWGLDPNPGLSSFGALMDKELVGAVLWGGSAEGLNGSVGMTIALLAIVLPLALLSWRRLPAPAPRVAPRRVPQPDTGPVSATATPGSGRSDFVRS